MHICIFEDQDFSNFLPLVYFRPVFELRSGALSNRERLEALAPGSRTSLFVRTPLSELYAEEQRGMRVNAVPSEDCWFINGRIIAISAIAKLVRQRFKESRSFHLDRTLIAAYVQAGDLPRFKNALSSGLISTQSFDGLPSEQMECSIASYPWELIHASAGNIEQDFGLLKKSHKKIPGKPPGVHILGKQHIVMGKNCVLKPGVVLDATDGPVILGNNVTIMANSVIQGPVYIGDNSLIKIGAKIYHGTSIGPSCKVGGEVEASVIQSYSNKQHDGFLGHSYLSSWINIGAGTNNSDLKNTYGTIKVNIGGTLIDTQSQFVGVVMGDHSKAGIATMLNSGTVVGVSCNIYGAGFQPKVVPSFSWGEPSSQTTYDLESSLSTARKMMARREILMSLAYENVFRNIYQSTSNERESAGSRRTD
ncbi:MAG TPA: putative sugar nucleotidyl transferase [Bacteroidota bacterium]|jgi:UDP-N-acetylglucosamine diphosphorylase/glucosamine-1-phosphate N-acetyltransferase|nr:putative sugar nucleotidyl transferase [Bacteroidota bacterium]